MLFLAENIQFKEIRTNRFYRSIPSNTSSFVHHAYLNLGWFPKKPCLFPQSKVEATVKSAFKLSSFNHSSKASVNWISPPTLTCVLLSKSKTVGGRVYLPRAAKFEGESLHDGFNRSHAVLMTGNHICWNNIAD